MRGDAYHERFTTLRAYRSRHIRAESPMLVADTSKGMRFAVTGLASAGAIGRDLTSTD
jgi:hypothetical protein